MQQIDVEMETGRFFCPVTGQLICDPEDETRPSPATKFVFYHEVGDFDFVAKELESLVERARADVEEAEEKGDEDGPGSVFDHFLSLIDTAETHPNLAVFVITTHGFACGPVSNTFAIGIDMAYEEES
jgi:hypothetical protein